LVPWCVGLDRFHCIWIIEKNLVYLDIFSSRVLENSGNMVD
jgi:hypothetical protein